MAGTGQGYDLSVTTYSPDGRVYQLDYAQKCVDNGPTCVAICCKDGIVFATEKLKQSKMLIHGTNKKAYAIEKRAGLCMAGLTPDGRLLVERARSEASNFKRHYGENIPGYLLAERVGMAMHYNTIYWSLRPYGAGVLIGVLDEEDVTDRAEKSKKAGVNLPAGSLFSVVPDGTVSKWYGKALGKGRQLANTEIEKLDLATLSCKDALFHVAKIIHKVHDEAKEFELEMNWICTESGYKHSVVPRAMVEEAETRAKAAIEEEEDE